MSFLTILSLVFRAIGLVQWAVAIEKTIADIKKAREVANAPQTISEELDYFDHHD